MGDAWTWQGTRRTDAGPSRKRAGRPACAKRGKKLAGARRMQSCRQRPAAVQTQVPVNSSPRPWPFNTVTHGTRFNPWIPDLLPCDPNARLHPLPDWRIRVSLHQNPASVMGPSSCISPSCHSCDTDSSLQIISRPPSDPGLTRSRPAPIEEHARPGQGATKLLDSSPSHRLLLPTRIPRYLQSDGPPYPHRWPDLDMIRASPRLEEALARSCGQILARSRPARPGESYLDRSACSTWS